MALFDSAETASTAIPVGTDYLSPILRTVFGGGMADAFSLGGIFTFVSVLWGIVVVFGYLLSFGLLYLYIYASINKGKLEEIADERIAASELAFRAKSGGGHLSSRLDELRAHVSSQNPNDWKLSIIEADIILDDTLKRQGYPGASLGERLRGISPANLSSLDDAWQAHKIRNQIAHGGADFVLTQQIAKETILKYERVFSELGIQ